MSGTALANTTGLRAFMAHRPYLITAREQHPALQPSGAVQQHPHGGRRRCAQYSRDGRPQRGAIVIISLDYEASSAPLTANLANWGSSRPGPAGAESIATF